MDGMRFSMPFESNGKVPYVLFNAAVGCKDEQLHDVQASSATNHFNV